MKKLTPAELFYKKALELLNTTHIPFMIAGTYAFTEYTGIRRPTKDLDIFCKTSDYPKIINFFAKEGYEVEITDDRWLAKIYKQKYYVDVIYGTIGNVWRVDDSWFEHTLKKTMFRDVTVKLVPPEEFVWTKLFMQDRNKYEAADVNHIIIKMRKNFDWKRLLFRMETHWELLFAQILSFRFVYPSERYIIPGWLLTELMNRVQEQLSLPLPQGKICRGAIISRFQYLVDYKKWGFSTEVEDVSIDYKTQHSIQHKQK